MLPHLDALLAGYELYAKQNQFAPIRDEARLSDALREAGALAANQETDEPAALFFALSRRPRTFGKAHGEMTLHITIEHARGLGFAVTANVAVLESDPAHVMRLFHRVPSCVAPASADARTCALTGQQLSMPLEEPSSAQVRRRSLWEESAEPHG